MKIDNKASLEDNAIRIIDFMEQLDYGQKVNFMTHLIKGIIRYDKYDIILDKKEL